MVSRRRFLRSLTASLLAAPLAAEAQPSPKCARLGILAPTSTRLPHYASFRQALWDLGYQNEVTLSIEERAVEGKAGRLSNLAVELVRGNVDLILASGLEATLRAARQATSTIPIIIVAIDYDPIALGYIASLSRPGGNVTSVFLQQLELTTKRFELLKEAVPSVARVLSSGMPFLPTNGRWFRPQRRPLVFRYGPSNCATLRTISNGHLRSRERSQHQRPPRPRSPGRRHSLSQPGR